MDNPIDTCSWSTMEKRDHDFLIQGYAHNFSQFLHKIELQDPTIAKHNSFATSFKSPFFLNEQNHPDFVAGDTRCQENVMLNRKRFITFESALLKVQY